MALNPIREKSYFDSPLAIVVQHLKEEVVANQTALATKILLQVQTASLDSWTAMALASAHSELVVVFQGVLNPMTSVVLANCKNKHVTNSKDFSKDFS